MHGNEAEGTTDLNAGLEVAAALGECLPRAPQRQPEDCGRPYPACGHRQAGVASWNASSSSSDEALANAAILALVA